MNFFRQGEKIDEINWDGGGFDNTFPSKQNIFKEATNAEGRKKHAPGEATGSAEDPGATGETSETCKAASTIISSDFTTNNFRREGGRVKTCPAPDPYDVQPHPTTRWRLPRFPDSGLGTRPARGKSWGEGGLLLLQDAMPSLAESPPAPILMQSAQMQIRIAGRKRKK